MLHKEKSGNPAQDVLRTGLWSLLAWETAIDIFNGGQHD
jgi:hypothetical protein